MIKKLAVAAFVGAVSMAATSAAFAEDIPATPINHGPMVMTGMGPAGDLFNLGMTPVNAVAPGVIAVTGNVGGTVVNAVPSATPPVLVGEEPAVRRHRKHRYAKRHTIKKAM